MLGKTFIDRRNRKRRIRLVDEDIAGRFIYRVLVPSEIDGKTPVPLGRKGHVNAATLHRRFEESK